MYPITNQYAGYTVTECLLPMGDGVKLYTRITVPAGVSKGPTVFIRTPYEAAHNGVAHEGITQEMQRFISRGYCLVQQHCRGRGDSEGVCVPYVERQDSLDSLSHIRNMTHYNGEIFLYGGSYLSTVHLCYLDTLQPDVKGAVLSIQTDRMFFRNYRNGCCFDFCNFDWWLRMLSRQFPEPKRENALIRPYRDIMRRALGEDYPPYTDLLMHDQYDDFWENDPRTHAVENLRIPVLFVEGWYDFYLEGMFSMWERLPENTRARSAFLVGPWGHGTSVSEDAQYPLEHGNIPDDWAVAWFDRLRDGANRTYPYGKLGQITYYSIGEDCWKQSPGLPEPRRGQTYWFGDAGKLCVGPVEAGSAATYTYDPEKRLNCFHYQNIWRAEEPGTVKGVISFLSEPFREQRSFFGKIRWHMAVRSDCEDTAFFIRIYFVDDTGAYNLTETITSLSYLYKDYRPGEKVIIDLDTPPVGFGVKQGGRLRVDISSDGGVYVPHANYKGHWAAVEQTRIAHNTLCLDQSFIELVWNEQNGESTAILTLGL